MSSEDEPNPTWETVSLPEQAEQYYVMSKKFFSQIKYACKQWSIFWGNKVLL